MSKARQGNVKDKDKAMPKTRQGNDKDKDKAMSKTRQGNDKDKDKEESNQGETAAKSSKHVYNLANGAADNHSIKWGQR